MHEFIEVVDSEEGESLLILVASLKQLSLINLMSI